MAHSNLPPALYYAPRAPRRPLTTWVRSADEDWRERLTVARIPILVVGFIALWIVFHVVRDGPGKALGGLFGLLDEPQYGEQARATRSGKLAERQLQPPAPEEDEPDSTWWNRP